MVNVNEIDNTVEFTLNSMKPIKVGISEFTQFERCIIRDAINEQREVDIATTEEQDDLQEELDDLQENYDILASSYDDIESDLDTLRDAISDYIDSYNNGKHSDELAVLIKLIED